MGKKSIKSRLEVIQSLEVEKANLQAQIDGEKERVKAWMRKYNTEKIESDYCTVYTTHKVNITYKLDALKRKLTKGVIRRFVDREYRISDLRGFKAVCDKHDIPLSAFKDCLTCIEIINTAKLDKLYDDGVISMLDLAGCYDSEEKQTIGFRLKGD